MKKTFIVFVLVLAAVLLSACGAFEKGSLSFVYPQPDGKMIVHQDDSGAPLSLPVTISSTFATARPAKITVVGPNGTYSAACNLQPNTDTACPNIPLNGQGKHTIEVQAFKSDGVTVVSAKNTVLWSPAYTPMDQVMPGFGEYGPLPGYGLIAFILAIIAAIVLYKIAGYGGGILAFLLAIVGLVIYFTQSGLPYMATQTLIVLVAMFVIAAVFLTILYFIKSGSSLTKPRVTITSIKADGSKMIWNAEQAYLGPSERAPQIAPLGDAMAKHAQAAIGAQNEAEKLLPYAQEYKKLTGK